MKEALLETGIMLLMVWTFQILVLLLRLFYFEGFTAVSSIGPRPWIMLNTGLLLVSYFESLSDFLL